MNNIGCVKAATEILGDKWTPQLLRCFANETEVRFCQLQDLVDGINPRTLSARLGKLEQKGIIKRQADGNSSRRVYALTDKGYELLPIIERMHAWSEAHAN